MTSSILALLVGCDATLEDGLSRAQADEILGALDAQGIAAERTQASASQPPRYRVSVARSALPSALGVLRREGLPRRLEPGFAEIYGSGGIIPSPAEERAREGLALAGELSRSMESIPGVHRARVHLALPRDARLDATPQAPRASVLVETMPGARADTGALRRLVAGAVIGLSPEAVEVVTVERAPAGSRLATTRVGPISVSPEDATTLRLLLGGAFATILTLAGALIWARWRQRKARLPG